MTKLTFISALRTITFGASGSRGKSWRFYRLGAVAVGATIGALIGGGTVDAHVYGNAKLVPEMTAALEASAMPHVEHVQVRAVPPKGCEDALGCTVEGAPWVYVNPHQGPWDRRLTFYHEIGHQWDFQNYTEDQWQVMMPLVAAPYDLWWGDPVAGEVWAEAYAWCSEGMRPRWYHETAYGWHPTVQQHEAVCRAIQVTLGAE